MGIRLIACRLSCLLIVNHVTGFSISRRLARNSGLSDALDILQRERRRVRADNFLGSEQQGEGRSLTLNDFTDWLNTNNEREVLDSDWLSDRGRFKDFAGNEKLGPAYSLQHLLAPPEIGHQSEETRNSELENILSDEREDDGNDIPEKKKKEEMINVKGEQKPMKKKSVTSDNLLLNTLTKEEFRALMKAMEKLQKQTRKLREKSESNTIPDDVNIEETLIESMPVGNIAMVEPVSGEELESVFDDNGPLVKETKIAEEKIPGQNGENFLQRTVSTEILPSGMVEDTEEALKNAIASEIEQEMSEDFDTANSVREEIGELEDRAKYLDPVSPEKLAPMVKYWLMSNYMGRDRPLQKRTEKRAVIMSDDLLGTDNDDDDEATQSDIRENYIDENKNPDTFADMVLEISRTPKLKAFMVKILELQGEVDHLRMVAKLEDLENDVLTNALNEATMGQKEGTVSDVEFDSLQNAIHIEEALKDLKISSGEGILPLAERDEIKNKRGESWRRKRGPEVHTDSRRPSPIDVAAQTSGSETGPPLTKEDIIRRMNNAFQHETSQEEEDEPNQIASLFLPYADTCPAVREYSTNCELADRYSLPVDYEARALCNLHQMCYSCGHSLHVAQDHCDFLYRAAATALCDEKENCVVESEIFLRTMKLKTRYVPHRLPHCRSTCTAKFLGML